MKTTTVTLDELESLAFATGRAIEENAPGWLTLRTPGEVFRARVPQTVTYPVTSLAHDDPRPDFCELDDEERAAYVARRGRR